MASGLALEIKDLTSEQVAAINEALLISGLRQHELTEVAEKLNAQLHLEIAERKLVEAERERLIAELQKTLARVKTLSGLIPICAWCKKIRSDEDYWQSVEDYVHAHTDATFSHGICPACDKKLQADTLATYPARSIQSGVHQHG